MCPEHNHYYWKYSASFYDIVIEHPLYILLIELCLLSTGHGSSLSLVSSSSSLYSSQEEKQAAEIRKLRKDLAEAQDKVGTLTNQLTTNVSHVL